MGREIRKVKKGWEHPKRDDGSYQPMFDEYYLDALNEWFSDHQKWLDGTHEDLKEHPEYKQEYPFYAMWNGNPPDVDYYRNEKWSEDEKNCFQFYENVSEGTPLSPVFETLQELEDWLVKTQGHSRKSAQAFCKSGCAPSMVILNGQMKSGVDSYDLTP